MTESAAKLTADLKAARALIGSPSKWCKGSYHATGDRHCTLGAIMVATPNFAERDAVREALLAALPDDAKRRPHALATYNDEHTHREVMALFDRAIAAAEETTEC